MFNNRDHREIARLLAGVLRLDHSVSVPEHGSIFERHGSKPVQLLKRRIAEAYGVPWAFPSTNGTTILNVLAILTACPLGAGILLNRDAHVSAGAAVIHGGLRPRYFQPAYDHRFGLSLGPTQQDVLLALNKYDDISCIFLTAPNYFGLMGEIGEIIALGHQRGLPVVVDAAHGPHFRFCSMLPKGAEGLGADLVCQSTHKVANALSQASVLLVRDERLLDRLYDHVNNLGLVSTSFSYPILVSLELAIQQLIDEGDEIWERAIGMANEFRNRVEEVPAITSFAPEMCIVAGANQFDRSRITIDVSETGMTGFEFEHRLNAEDIYPEMATFNLVVFLLTSGTQLTQIDPLLEAIENVAETGSGVRINQLPAPPSLPLQELIPREAYWAPAEIVSVNAAVGRISRETIATFPPGAPIIVVGERITSEIVDYLKLMTYSGAVLKGAFDPSFKTMKVVA